MKYERLRGSNGKFVKVPFDPNATSRLCTVCKEEKDLALFGKSKDGVGGVKNICKKCASDASARYNKRNPERARRNRRAVTVRDKGMSIEQYERMFEDQGFSCAMCGATETGGRGAFPIDHCHRTGAVRGILCNNCNLVLGQARDDISLLEKAIAYLRRFSS